jgi:hypothetical protein
VPTTPADVFQRIRDESEQKLWIPGAGEVDVKIVACQRVCREYDERLELAKHELTGDWVVFIKLDRDSLYPVIGIGPELCDPEELSQRLWKADARRHGDKVLRDINEHNERIRRESRSRALAADEEVAEHFEWGFRREGVLSPKVFIPRSI